MASLTETLLDFLGIGRQPADSLRLALVVEFCHQRCVEVFGKKDKVTLVVAHGIHKKFHLLKKGHPVSCRYASAIVPTYADSGLGLHSSLCGTLMSRYCPYSQQAGVVLGLLIIGKVVAHHLAHVEVVRELKGQHRRRFPFASPYLCTPWGGFDRHICSSWGYVRQTWLPSGSMSRKVPCGIHTYGVPNAVRDNPDE